MHTSTLLTDYTAGSCTSWRDPGSYRCAWSVGEEEEEGLKKSREAKLRSWGLTEGEAELYLGVSEGFLLVVSTKGDMVFLSDNVSKHLGLTQVDLIGHSLYDFSHPCDHKEIGNNLRTSGDCCWAVERDFVMRMKSTLTHRGRTTNIKSASWKVLHCEGRMKACMSSSFPYFSSSSAPSSTSYLLLSCKPLLLCHRLVITHTFTSQHRLDLRFTRCDSRVKALLGYSPEELQGRSLYQLCHMLDTSRLNRSHRNLLSMEPVGERSVQDAGAGRGLRVGGEPQRPLLRPACPRVSSQCSGQSSIPPACIFSITYILSGVLEPSLQLSLDQSDLRNMIRPGHLTSVSQERKEERGLQCIACGLEAVAGWGGDICSLSGDIYQSPHDLCLTSSGPKTHFLYGAAPLGLH
ncbi:unnamed protein product [Boreogadus saida]